MPPLSETVKLIDMPASPAIVKCESIIMTEHTPNVIEVGQVYQDKKIIVSVMKHYSVMNKFHFRVKRSSARSYYLVCVGDNCTWYFKSTSINKSALFKDQKFNSLHTYSLMDNTYIQCKATSMVVDSMVMPKYADPKTIYTPKNIQTDMLSEHGMNLTYMQAWRAKEKALNFFIGHHADSYSHLHCRPVVVVDGTFLKSAYRGIMLTTNTMDATDRNGSILKAISTVYIGMSHYACMWHIWTNERSKFKKGHLKLSELYFAMTRSYTLDEFNEKMSKLEETDTRVKTYIYDIGYRKWAWVRATVNRTWTMTSNIIESLNAVTKDVRELPVVELLEYMRTLLERWTNEKLLNAKGTFT
ncbi:uncharacterized protein LOC142167915 [Nicotiana tabacum]|uniref:Uncharacterized protein LOC142167915 n=1 Tax=Nicotiana tabacum TaxID=4097 RepID=A0AC58SHR9_TOBAC